MGVFDVATQRIETSVIRATLPPAREILPDEEARAAIKKAIATQLRPVLTTVSWAYPITWTLSSTIFLIYFLKADWIHNFDRIGAKNGMI